jgi:hypothetical protein
VKHLADCLYGRGRRGVPSPVRRRSAVLGVEVKAERACNRQALDDQCVFEGGEDFQLVEHTFTVRCRHPQTVSLFLLAGR